MTPRASDPAEPPDPSLRTRAAAPPPESSRRILIVDSDHRVREGIAGLIALSDGLEVVGTTSRADETLDAVRDRRPGVLVIDPYLPDLASGLALISALRAAYPALRIVATCRDGGHDGASLAAGADACVEQGGDPAVFQAALVSATQRPDTPTGRPGATVRRGRADSPSGAGGSRAPTRPSRADRAAD